jgi:1-aminocyclopropane-1-carboxylate deaminase/D-cysteine desulfhydrase-like pyridoxal-dependent ACC family enzyme
MNNPLDPLPPSPVAAIQTEVTEQAQIRLLIKRDDMLQPAGDEDLCGNKVRKLKYNLAAAHAVGQKRLLTFGGAYSNHIAAVARAGRYYGFETIGIIRGEAHTPLNPTLSRAVSNGMQLHYLDRSTYRQKQLPAVIDVLRQQFGDCYLIPEGGTNDLALQGSGEIIAEIEDQLGYLPDYLVVACGTGGTLAGMIRTAAGRSQLLGVSALKGDFMPGEVQKWLGPDFPHRNWIVNTGYHFGGYAKFPKELRKFVQEFEGEHGILLDPVYTSKLAFGVLDLIGKGYFSKGSSVMMVHTGGLQGWGGMRDGE